MTTITLAEIIELLAEVIGDLTPTTTAPQSVGAFRRNLAPKPPLRQWLPAAGGNDVARLFEVARVGRREDGGINHHAARLATVPLIVTLAYSAQPTLYGFTERHQLEALIEADAHQIHDAISLPTGLAGVGHIACYPTIERPDQGDRIWFQDVSVDVLFYAQRGT
jgi:hypothetical protein